MTASFSPCHNKITLSWPKSTVKSHFPPLRLLRVIVHHDDVRFSSLISDRCLTECSCSQDAVHYSQVSSSLGLNNYLQERCLGRSVVLQSGQTRHMVIATTVDSSLRTRPKTLRSRYMHNLSMISHSVEKIIWTVVWESMLLKLSPNVRWTWITCQPMTTT